MQIQNTPANQAVTSAPQSPGEPAANPTVNDNCEAGTQTSADCYGQSDGDYVAGAQYQPNEELLPSSDQSAPGLTPSSDSAMKLREEVGLLTRIFVPDAALPGPGTQNSAGGGAEGTADQRAATDYQNLTDTLGAEGTQQLATSMIKSFGAADGMEILSQIAHTLGMVNATSDGSNSSNGSDGIDASSLDSSDTDATGDSQANGDPSQPSSASGYQSYTPTDLSNAADPTQRSDMALMNAYAQAPGSAGNQQEVTSAYQDDVATFKASYPTATKQDYLSHVDFLTATLQSKGMSSQDASALKNGAGDMWDQTTAKTAGSSATPAAGTSNAPGQPATISAPFSNDDIQNAPNGTAKADMGMVNELAKNPSWSGDQTDLKNAYKQLIAHFKKDYPGASQQDFQSHMNYLIDTLASKGMDPASVATLSANAQKDSANYWYQYNEDSIPETRAAPATSQGNAQSGGASDNTRAPSNSIAANGK